MARLCIENLGLWLLLDRESPMGRCFTAASTILEVRSSGRWGLGGWEGGYGRDQREAGRGWALCPAVCYRDTVCDVGLIAGTISSYSPSCLEESDGSCEK